MKKFIFIINAVELLEKLLMGKRVEGALFIDKGTGRLTFKAYQRKSPQRPHCRLIRQLEHGWVKESKERIRVFESIPKELGSTRVMSIIDRETKEVKEALIERELIEFC